MNGGEATSFFSFLFFETRSQVEKLSNVICLLSINNVIKKNCQHVLVPPDASHAWSLASNTCLTLKGETFDTSLYIIHNMYNIYIYLQRL